MFIIVAVSSVALAPYLTIKRTHKIPLTLHAYLHQTTLFALAGIVIIIPLLWVMQFRPSIESGRSLHYVGRFEVVKKREFIGLYFLLLFPGKRNWIKVDEKTFRSFKTGEVIELKRATFGNLTSLRKVPNLRQRINADYNRGRYRRARAEESVLEATTQFKIFTSGCFQLNVNR